MWGIAFVLFGTNVRYFPLVYSLQPVLSIIYHLQTPSLHVFIFYFITSYRHLLLADYQNMMMVGYLGIALHMARRNWILWMFCDIDLTCFPYFKFLAKIQYMYALGFVWIWGSRAPYITLATSRFSLSHALIFSLLSCAFKDSTLGKLKVGNTMCDSGNYMDDIIVII